MVATGHNLDDEAAVLYGNVLRWDLAYLGRQLPVLPAGDGFVRKVKPLVRLSERETAAYCVLQGIDYIVEECPMAAGNRHLGYKEALNDSRGALAGDQGGVLLRLPRADGSPGGVGGRGGTSGPPPLPDLRLADRGRACAPSAGWSNGPAATAGRPPPTEAPVSRPFGAGERVLLFDSKDRRYLVTLSEGGEFHTHSGPVSHDLLIGSEEGSVVRSSRGARYTRGPAHPGRGGAEDARGAPR